MCKAVVINKEPIPGSITVEFQRDASTRAVDLVIVNKSERYGEVGVKLI